MQTLLTHDVDFEPDSLRVLTLSKYVELEEQSDFDKDRARLPLLRETLRLQQDKGDD